MLLLTTLLTTTRQDYNTIERYITNDSKPDVRDDLTIDKEPAHTFQKKNSTNKEESYHTTITDAPHYPLANNSETNKENESVIFPSSITSSNNTSIRNDDDDESDGILPQPRLVKNPLESRERLLEDAVDFGLKAMEDLVNVKEPQWYQMGLFLDKEHPASRVAQFGAPATQKAMDLARLGYAAVEASRKIAESFAENVSRQSAGFPEDLQSRLLQEDCPLRGRPRCPAASLRYRTSDGTCNNPEKPWKGSAMLPMQRFLPPTYEDGIQSIRRSLIGSRLPSARDISVRVHRDKNHEIQTVSLMFMQWGQFIDHDVTSVVKSRSFNGSIPRCCDRGGREMLPPELTHPTCLPIEVSDDDWFLGQFGIRCLEFIRSAPSTRIDCDLGWREQINQVTPFIDASTIYGSDVETSDSVRTFRNGKVIYGRARNGPLQPPDPPGGELCRSGALSTECLQAGDGRVSEQPGLTALHTIWVRFHNKIAGILGKLNQQWSDEKIFQETRKIVYSAIQHITFREFLPIVLGQEVIELFELNLKRKGFYTKYDPKVNPAIANSFSTAAYRFGHSMVQNSYVRADSKHRPLFNNVSLHEDLDNQENIWSFGSLDRLLLGFCNQASQRRDEFVADELTNHLFQSQGMPFGMDLVAINIQRGRDHGIPSYTSWRQPCGLAQIDSWLDLESVMSFESVQRFRSLYQHVDDIDLFSGGLAEKPVRGGVVGPTFACIIAQQFLNLRKGDRFWYENDGFESSFTPAQLQQIRRVTLAQVLCQTLQEIETVQPFVFLSHDNFRNVRMSCNSPMINNFDLTPWAEREFNNEVDSKLDFDLLREEDEIELFEEKVEARASSSKRKITTSTTVKSTPKTSKPKPATVKRSTKKKSTEKPLQFQITNITTSSVLVENKYGDSSNIAAYNDIPQRPSFQYQRPQSYYQVNQQDPNTDVTYLFGVVSEKTTPTPPNRQQKPLEVNIKIQYYLPTTEKTTKRPKKKKRPNTSRPSNTYLLQSDPIVITKRPSQATRPQYSQGGYDYNRPTYSYNRPASNDFYNDPTTTRPYYNVRPTSDYYNRPNNDQYTNNRPYRPTNDYNSNSDVIITKRPYVIRPQSYYQQTLYEEEPFSTSQKPYIYRPSANIYNNDIYNTRPQDYYNSGQSSNPQYLFGTYNKRPTGQTVTYNRDDPILDVYSQVLNDKNDHFQDNIPKKPSFGQFNDNKPTSGHSSEHFSKPIKIYSIGHVQKLDNVHDKLDFKSRYISDKRDKSYFTNIEDEGDRRFVKISSIKATPELSPKIHEGYWLEPKEGAEFDLNEAITTKGSFEEKKLKIVQIEVLPSEIGDDHWLVFNATEEITPLLLIPDINSNISCSNELPQPINNTMAFAHNTTNSTDFLTSTNTTSDVP